MATDILLEMRNVTLAFGGLMALDDFNIKVEKNKICALIGPNGAGKSTAFNCISRFYSPNAGDILFEGRSILRYRPNHIAKLGIGRTFQNLELFEHMTVLDNILVGYHLYNPPKIFQSMFFSRQLKKNEVKTRYKAEEIIDFLDLQPYREVIAGDIPYGVKKRIEIARALATQPKLILLDEPAAGLNREEAEDLSWWLLDIKKELGITLLIIEHDLSFVMKLADSLAVIESGQLIVQGLPEEVKQDQRVIAAYMGEAETNAKAQ